MGDQDNLKLQETPKEAAEDNTAKETKPGSLDPEGVNKTLSSKSDVNDVKPTATEKKSKVVQLKQNFQKTMTQQNQKDQDNINLGIPFARQIQPPGRARGLDLTVIVSLGKCNWCHSID